MVTTPEAENVVEHNVKTTAGKEKLKAACSLAGEAASDMVSEARGKAEQKYEEGKQRSSELSGEAEKTIRENPLIAVGAAFAAGWLFSKLIK